MDELTRAALETVVTLKRRGLVSLSCPNEGSCQCPEHVVGLGATRRAPMPLVVGTYCEGGYVCPCSLCQKERDALVRKAQAA